MPKKPSGLEPASKAGLAAVLKDVRATVKERNRQRRADSFHQAWIAKRYEAHKPYKGLPCDLCGNPINVKRALAKTWCKPCGRRLGTW